MGCFLLRNFVALIGIILVGLTATSGAAVAVAPKASSNGICYIYTVQAGETCSMIAQAHSITVADIETYNARSWAWSGCGHLPQGTFICLSSGEPMMPAALPNAVCGPQVPGTTRPNIWSELGSLNPCVANECCASWGLCGTTPDFCISAAHPPAALPISTGTHPTEWTTSKKTTASTSTAQSIQKPASSETSSSIKIASTSKATSTSKTTLTSATKSVPKPTSITKTIKTTSTRKTTSMKPTKSSQTKTSSATKAAATPSTWSLIMYSKKDCKGDYYLLQGHNVGYSNKCLNLHGGLSNKSSDTGVSCKWFTNGGDTNTKCDAGTLEDPQSWVFKGGICTVYNNKKCDHSDNYSNAYMGDKCRNRGKFDTPRFLSMTCYYPD